MGFDDVSTGSTWSWFPAVVRGGAGDPDDLPRGAGARERARPGGGGRRGRSAGSWPGTAHRRRAAVGCFMAVEFVKDRVTKERDPEVQERLARRLSQRGLLPTHPRRRSTSSPRCDAARRLGTVLGILDEAIGDGTWGPARDDADRFDELAGGLNHPEGVAWNPCRRPGGTPAARAERSTRCRSTVR